MNASYKILATGISIISIMGALLVMPFPVYALVSLDITPSISTTGIVNFTINFESDGGVAYFFRANGNYGGRIANITSFGGNPKTPSNTTAVANWLLSGTTGDNDISGEPLGLYTMLFFPAFPTDSCLNDSLSVCKSTNPLGSYLEVTYTYTDQEPEEVINGFSISSASSSFTSSLTDIGMIIVYAVGAAVTILIGLLGLYFGYRTLKKYVTGKNF